MSADTRSKTGEWELRGVHVAGFFLVFFGVIFSVNFLMASFASGSWTGLIAKNGYVASKDLAIMHKKRRLAVMAGWSMDVAMDGGTVVLTVDGIKTSGDDLVIAVEAERPLNEAEDKLLAMERVNRTQWRATEVLPDGRWTVVATVSSGDYELTERLSLVPGTIKTSALMPGQEQPRTL